MFQKHCHENVLRAWLGGISASLTQIKYFHTKRPARIDGNDAAMAEYRMPRLGEMIVETLSKSTCAP